MLNIPSLVPGHVGASLQHVVSMPSRDWDKGYGHWVISNFLDEGRDFLLDYFKPCLAVWWLSRVHLVDSNNKLLDTQGVGQKGVFSSLTILRDTSLKLTSTQSGFFWGSGEANSQTNSLYEAADRPNSLQTTLSVDFMVYKLYGLQNLRSVD